MSKILSRFGASKYLHPANKLRKLYLFLFSLILLSGLGLGYLTTNVFADSNLLVNPGFETGDLTGWNLLQNGGDGWSNSWGAHSGNYGFDTSYEMDSVSQEVDLIGSGYNQNQLDNQQPPIVFSVWLNDRCDSGAQYYITYELIGDDDSTVAASSGNTFGNSGSTLEVPAPCGTWKQESYTFNSYGSGVRYAYIEFGGYSDNFWAGNYGAQFDDASISVNSTPNTPTSLGPSSTVSGSTSSNSQPTLSAVLSDPGVGSNVQYEIQISSNSSFTNPVVDYTSGLQAPGSISFTVGQAAGSGTYTAGSASQTLANGTYYWRIDATGDDGLVSSWALANSNSAAFVVGETDPPATQTADPPDPPDPQTGYGTPNNSDTTVAALVSGSVIAIVAGSLIIYRHLRKTKPAND